MTESMKYYESIRRKYPETVSKDQFYQIAHAPYGRCGADERGLAMVSVYPLWKADDHTG